ncbi:60 kDa SS-A/Ro ribonucleoprotein [Phlyctochytrium planicorne]|nr:60 kDa SS-A/Ro ribonucleoprotein [Phlyctochytrium planicorne]
MEAQTEIITFNTMGSTQAEEPRSRRERGNMERLKRIAPLPISYVNPVFYNQPLAEAALTRNNAGGACFQISATKRLMRFLILGTEGGTFYVGEKRLTMSNIHSVMEMLKDGRGSQIVRMVKDVSLGGRAARQEIGVLFLAMCARFGEGQAKDEAYRAVVDVCRTPTLLFLFVKFIGMLGKQKRFHVSVEAPDAEACEGEEPHPDGEIVRKPKKSSPHNQGKGWGRGLRRAVEEWYNCKKPEALLYLATKYRGRNGWTHADILRMGHVMPSTGSHDLILAYLTYGVDRVKSVLGVKALEPAVTPAVPMVEDSPLTGEDFVKVEVENSEDGKSGSWADDVPEEHPVEDATADKPEKKKWSPSPKTYTSQLKRGRGKSWRLLHLMETYNTVLHSTDVDYVSKCIREHHLAREHIPMSMLNHVQVWEALMEDMPMTAMIRNLGKMTSIGVLTESTENLFTKKVVAVLSDEERIKKAKVHPMAILLALTTYKAGRGYKGSLCWIPVASICTALEFAFHMSFGNVESSGKRYMIAIDVSGSMSVSIAGTFLQCRMAAAAMAMTVMKKEPNSHIVAFCDSLVKLDILRDDPLSVVLKKTGHLPFGSTDCAAPMLHALQNEIPVDVFVVLTDSETWYGKVRPDTALKRYREAMVKDAKLVVVGMVASDFSIADPDDEGMLDVVGFDSNAPAIIRDFALGSL